jgi:hypothetical protein
MAKREGAMGAMTPLAFCNSFSQFNDNYSSHYILSFKLSVLIYMLFSKYWCHFCIFYYNLHYFINMDYQLMTLKLLSQYKVMVNCYL